MLHNGPMRSFVNILSITMLLLVACETTNSSERTDYISSLTNKLKLLDQNGKLLLNLYEYIEGLQDQVETLRRLEKHLQQPQLLAKGQEEEFLSNPMNCLSLIRQMHSDWPRVEQLMQQPVGQKQMDFMRQSNEQRPNKENLEEALVAMHRIKESYELKSVDLANGLIDGLQTDAKLSPLECYEMGLLYYNGSLYDQAVEWLETARDLTAKHPSDVFHLLGLTRSNISYLLAQSYTAQGNLELARHVLQTEPDLSSRAEQLVEYFQANRPEISDNIKLIYLTGPYAQLCGSSYKPKPTRLLCSYKSSPTPFLRLAPFRMEQISSDPDLFVFHNIVSSTEIELLQEETELYFESRELDPTMNSYYLYQRTANEVWLPDPEFSTPVNLLAQRIRQRIFDLSDLSSSDKYMADVIKYGFGGHYSIHEDFLNDTKIIKDDRIATILLYLNKVPSGGGTMFVQLNLTVQPEPGKALLWYNLNLDTFDYELRNSHAACPVKIGTKWVVTQWIHENDQMFTRPCYRPPKSRKYVD